jgi:hypothetical protein
MPKASSLWNCIVSMSVDPDEQHNTVSFNVTWAYTGDGATSTIP